LDDFQVDAEAEDKRIIAANNDDSKSLVLTNRQITSSPVSDPERQGLLEKDIEE
jgi:hypothetical protein